MVVSSKISSVHDSRKKPVMEPPSLLTIPLELRELIYGFLFRS